MNEIHNKDQKENWTQKQFKEALNKRIKTKRIEPRSGKLF